MYILLLLPLWIIPGAADPVVVSGGPTNDYESWIIRTNDDRLMVIFCRNPDWQSGDLYVTFSTNNGDSWEVPMVIIEDPEDQATLSFLQLPGDTFRLWYASNESSTYGIYTAHSLDGISWNRDGAIDIGWGPYDMHYDPTVILEEDSSLTMSYRGPGGAYIAHKPYGGTWDTVLTLVGPSGYRPRIMKHSGGTYVFVYHRNISTGYEVFVRTSQDRVNWTAELRLTFDGNSHDPFPNETSDGAYMVYYATHQPPAYNLYRRLSYDVVHWEAEEQITFDATNNTQPHFFCETNDVFLVWAHAIIFPDDHDVYFEKCDFTGITETSKIQVPRRYALVEISPNPCSRMVRVKTPTSNPGAVQLRIYDSQGRTVPVCTNLEYDGNNALTINTGDLQVGVYFLRMRCENIDYYTRFVVVR